MPTPVALFSTVAVIAVATALAMLLRRAVPGPSLELLFLVAVLLVSVRFGFWAGITASIVAFLAFNFFLVEPLYTFAVHDAGDLFSLLVLLAAGATAGFLAGRLKEEADTARSRANVLEHLAHFTRDVAAAATGAAIESVMVRHLAKIDGGSCIILRTQQDGLVQSASEPAALRLSTQDMQAAERALRRSAGEAAAAPGWDGNDFAFLPLPRGQGVVGWRPGMSSRSFAADNEQLRRTIIHQGTLALETWNLSRDAEQARLKAEREALRAALLSSLSHDLRTPLATILGGVSTLRELGDTMSREAHTDLLAAIEEEAERLSRYVANLLHMTRLQAGLDLRLEWIDAVDTAHGAIERARRGHPGRQVTLAVPQAPPLVRADASLLEQALFNLIDNALKFSAPDGAVSVHVTHEAAEVSIAVVDTGPGIAEDELPRLFEPFAPGKHCTAAGLGLAIASGIVKAIGGELSVESPRRDSGSGTAVCVLLPLAKGPVA